MHFETIALIGQPISLADLRSHLRIDPPDEPSARDSAISAMLAAAVQLAQGYTGTALCAQRLRVFSPLAAGWQRLCLPFKAASIDAAQLLQGDAWLVQDPASFSLLPLGAGVAVQWQGAASLPTATALELELSTPVQALDDATRHALDRVRLDVLLGAIDAFDHHVLVIDTAQHGTALALVLAGNHDDFVALANLFHHAFLTALPEPGTRSS